MSYATQVVGDYRQTHIAAHSLDTFDYDRLEYLANQGGLLRQMLGVHDGIVRGKEFDRQTIIDNVQLLDDATLREINQIIVEAGHGLVKKKETEALHIKIDSFP